MLKIVDSLSLLLGIYRKEIKLIYRQIKYKYVHASIICNSEKLEVTQYKTPAEFCRCMKMLMIY